MEVFLITSLVFGLIFGFICSSMAGSRNRGAVKWFFLGFFGGLLSMIVLACLGKGTNGMKQCGKCAEHIMKEARVCKFCGSDA